MSKAYVIMPEPNYEYAEPVRVFLKKPEAEAFLVVLHAYAEKRPVEKQIPRPSWPEEQVEENDRWYKRLVTWRKRHPAGEDASYHSRFTICEVPLGPRSQRRVKAF